MARMPISTEGVASTRCVMRVWFSILTSASSHCSGRVSWGGPAAERATEGRATMTDGSMSTDWHYSKRVAAVAAAVRGAAISPCLRP